MAVVASKAAATTKCLTPPRDNCCKAVIAASAAVARASRAVSAVARVVASAATAAARAVASPATAATRALASALSAAMRAAASVVAAASAATTRPSRWASRLARSSIGQLSVPPSLASTNWSGW